MRSGRLKRTVLAAVAGTVWTQLPQVALRLRWLSFKCWFMGHDDWIRRTPDRLYLECVECGRETQGWATGKRHSSDRAGGVDNPRVIQRQGHCSPASVCSPMRSPTRCERSRSHHGGDITLAA